MQGREPGNLPQPPVAKGNVPSALFSVVTDRAEAAIGKPLTPSRTLSDRVIQSALAVLRTEGPSWQELSCPSDEQLEMMVGQTLGHLVQQREENHQPIEGWEPEILSVMVSVLNLPEEDMQIGLATKTEGQPGDVTAVTISYSPAGPDDDKIYTDTYGIREKGGAPYVIDEQRYEGRRPFPEIDALVDKIKTGNLTEALADFTNIKEARKEYVFAGMNRYVSPYDSIPPEEIRHVLQFLLEGTQRGTFSIERLAAVLQTNDNNETPAHNVFRRLPEYPQAMELLKARLVPQDENGTNLSSTVIRAMPWIMDDTTITDDEFQRLADLLPRWQQRFEEEYMQHLPVSVPEGIPGTLGRDLPNLARTLGQLDIALKVFQTLENGGRFLGGDSARQRIAEIQAKKDLLSS